jgi:O-succinylbenzoic acid--CoA ligase
MHGATLSVFDAARDAPGELAIIAGNEALTYAEVATRVERRLRELHAAGALDHAGQRPVAVIARPTLGTFVTTLALFAAGTPVLVMHPRVARAELTALMARAGAVPEPFGGPGGALPPLPAFDAERIAALVPTSGSTGEPRVVRLSHRAFLAAAAASAANLGIERDRWLVALPLAHVGGLGAVTRSLVNRRAVILFEPERSLLGELPAFVACAEQQAATLVSLVPTILDRLLAEPVAWRPSAALRAVLLGGAAIPRALVARARAAGVPVLPTYGMTETCAQIATGRYASRLAPVPAGHDLFPSGPPLAGNEVRIRDGILEVRSASLFSGYLDEPASDPSGGWFRTNDRALSDAHDELTVLGRASDLIITGGENVDPLEVEAALESLPGVRRAFVFGTPDVTFGQIVSARLVTESDALSGRELAGLLAERLAAYKLPRLVERVAELPLTPAGKLDRRAAHASSAVSTESPAYPGTRVP